MKQILFPIFIATMIMAQFPYNLEAQYENGGNVQLNWEISPEPQLSHYLIYRNENLIVSLFPDNPEGIVTNYVDRLIPCLDTEQTFYYQVGVEYLDGSIGFSEGIYFTIFGANNCIYVEDTIGPVGVSMPITVSMTNEEELYGFMFTMNFLSVPVLLDSVQYSERLDGYTVSAQQLQDGSILIIAFSLTGSQILGNEGPLIDVWVTSQEAGLTDVCLQDVTVSHPFGHPWAHGQFGVVEFVCEDFLGDLNHDSIIDILDVILLINCILSEDDCPCGDMNNTGDIDVLDVVLLVDIILEY